MIHPHTEAISPRHLDLDAWDAATALEALWESQMSGVAAVRPALAAIGAAAEATAARLATGAGRIVYAGAGTSARIGAGDGAELSPTFGWPEDRVLLLVAGGPDALLRAVENAEDLDDWAREVVASHGVGPFDVVIGVAASGTTPYTLACLEAARGQGALTIAVANSPGTALLAAADHAILAETGPEVLAGSTRLKAGTAQKVVLNLFSTLVMLRLGHVHRGRMVSMRARNEKLRQRAARMVEDLAECGPEDAAFALAAADGNIKLAVLIAGGEARDVAAQRLERHQGSLRAALIECSASSGADADAV